MLVHKYYNFLSVQLLHYDNFRSVQPLNCNCFGLLYSLLHTLLFISFKHVAINQNYLRCNDEVTLKTDEFQCRCQV